MTAEDLAASARSDSTPPPGLTPSAETLWLARAGRWDDAHDRCQNLPDPDGAWIHAHLHRQEGDLGNASYWYARAGRATPPSVSIAEEWIEIAGTLL